MSVITIENELDMPNTLKIVGRIPGENVLDYVNKTKNSGTNDVVHFDLFTSVSDSGRK